MKELDNILKKLAYTDPMNLSEGDIKEYKQAVLTLMTKKFEEAVGEKEKMSKGSRQLVEMSYKNSVIVKYGFNKHLDQVKLRWAKLMGGK